MCKMEFQKYNLESRINIRALARVGLLGLLLPSLMPQVGFAGEKLTVDVAYVEGKDVFSYQKTHVESGADLKSVSGVAVVVEDNVSNTNASLARAASTASKSRAVTSRSSTEGAAVMTTVSKTRRSHRARSTSGPDASKSLAITESRSRPKRKQRP